jgi:uncharacterized protein with gpF-like domain
MTPNQALAFKLKTEKLFESTILEVLNDIARRKSEQIQNGTYSSQLYSSDKVKIFDALLGLSELVKSEIFPASTKSEVSDIEANLNREITDLANNSASESTDHITDTLEGDIRQAIDSAREEFTASGQTPTDKAMAAAVLAMLIRRLKSRGRTISVFETNRMVEAIRSFKTVASNNAMSRIIDKAKKQLENNNLLGSQETLSELDAIANYSDADASKITGAANGENLVKAAVLVALAKKKWRTMGDKFVRETHSRANGQSVAIGAPFSVGGSLLNYPGDTSLGAPIKEVINCRCSVEYYYG